MPQVKVLLLGANYRAMFCWAEQLNKAGMQVYVFDSEPIALQRSPLIKEYFRASCRDENIAQFVQELTDLLGRQKFDYLIPVNDFALEVCMQYKERIQPLVNFPVLPAETSYQYANNKYKLAALCTQLGLKAPASFDLPGLTAGQIEGFTYPVIVKPVYSRHLFQNTITTGSVILCQSAGELKRLASLPAYSLYMVQQYVAGEDVGFNFIADKGRVVMSYFDQQLFSRFGTESAARVTIPRVLELETKLKKVLAEIKWDGVGMFDLLYNGTDYYIIELNGRLWASANLGVKAGCNIPEAYISSYILNRPVLNGTEYRSGVTLVNIRNCVRAIKSAGGVKGAARALFKLIPLFFRTLFSTKSYIDDPYAVYF